MADDRQALALELRQVIQSDRMAADIIADAHDTEHKLGESLEKQKATILADAEKRHRQMLEIVQAEQEEALARRTGQAQARIAAQQKQLEETVAKHKAGWVDEIVARITKP